MPTRMVARSTESQLPEQKPRLSARERRLAQILAERPVLSERLMEEADCLDLLGGPLRRFCEALSRSLDQETELRLERVVEALDRETRGAILAAIAETYPETKWELAFDKELNKLREECLHRTKRHLAELMRAATHRGDEAAFLELAERDRRLTSDLQSLKRRHV